MISQAMRGAELTYRRELAARTIADVAAEVERTNPQAPENTRSRFHNLKS
ncbi:hypothetical protein AB0E69_02765 [Kribbella sp. NPDC026611]